jgi:hypothetical protein
LEWTWKNHLKPEHQRRHRVLNLCQQVWKSQRDNMGTFSFTLPNGQPFEVKGPSGLSLDQAKAIFDKQASTGSLVGLKPGMSLSAATQAAQGLASAQSLLTQAQSSITGALGAGIPGAAAAIGSVSSALGAAGGAINGGLSGVAAGLTGAVGAAVSASGAASIITGGAATAVSTINNIIATVPLTNEINITDFAKQIPAVASIGPLSLPDVTGVLAQAKNLVGQASNVLTSEKGLGAFGLGAEQLEKAGIIKPGLAKLVTSGASSITNLLKSPAAFTGKDGIKSATDLLSNPAKQAGIQQDLMAQGVAGLKALGVPTDLLSPQGLAGTALNAAKSIPGAAAFLKGLPIPNDPAGALTAAFNANVRDGAFAANLSLTKIPPAFKAEVTPVPAADTVDRDTVNAAVTRVLGNPKVPEPNYGPVEPPPGTATAQISRITELIAAADAFVAEIEPKFRTLGANISSLLSRQTITDAEWEAVAAEQSAIVDEFNRRRLPIIGPLNEEFNNSLVEAQRATAAPRLAFNKRLQILLASNSASKTLITYLSNKIQGPS